MVGSGAQCNLISSLFGPVGVDADTVSAKSANVESTVTGNRMGYILIAIPEWGWATGQRILGSKMRHAK